MRTELARQSALLKALLGRESADEVRQALVELGLRSVQAGEPGNGHAGAGAQDPSPDLEAGLQAYRSNAIALSERALAGAFPYLAERLGRQFASLAWAFWRHAPPAVGDLGAWGAALPDFLRETADETLAGVAAFEWALHCAERAADASLDAASLALLNGDPAVLGLVFRPGLVLLELPAAAIEALAGHRAWLPGPPQEPEPAAAAAPMAPALEPVADGPKACDAGKCGTGEAPQASTPVLVWRKDWRGRATHLEAAAAAFMRSALAGDSIETALSSSTSAQAVPEARAGAFWDFTVFLHQALQDQWLMAVRRLDAAHGEEECNDGPEPNP